MEGVLKELSLLARTLFGWFCLFAILALILFSVGFRDAQVWGTLLPVPSFTSIPTAIQIFQDIREDLLPPGVRLISLSPFAGFVTQVSVALLASFILTLPVLLYRILAYVSPALHEAERRLMLIVLIPSFLLFLAGVTFAYQLVIPTTFTILYSFAPELGAEPFFLVNEFLSTAAFLMISVGLMFLVPVMMVFLSAIRLIEASFWRAWWRHSLLGFLLFAAFVTPDGSGITMLMLSLPMAALYAGGLAAAAYLERRRFSGDKRGGTLGE
ncbi:MAG TPA: twin-arginine translocase subunit TatC [Candidatus Paceibacterota bacterium]|nr:twin-arginine translocase subunit TatC [Candidatus Paceibacterota bacterium]